jgi:hypothetical protein
MEQRDAPVADPGEKTPGKQEIMKPHGSHPRQQGALATCKACWEKVSICRSIDPKIYTPEKIMSFSDFVAPCRCLASKIYTYEKITSFSDFVTPCIYLGRSS